MCCVDMLCFVLFGLVVKFTIISAHPIETKFDMSRDNLTGESLIEFATAHNLTLLKALGMTFVNMERSFNERFCMVDPCSVWSEWSACTTIQKGHFGAQTRSRTCWHGNTRPCANDGIEQADNESRMCEGWCPDDYTLSDDTRFCTRVGVEKVTQAEGESLCQKDGGHLMNVDSADRWLNIQVALNKTLDKTVSYSYFWIDGTRPGPNLDFQFKSGVDPSSAGLSFWKAGQPNVPAAEFCIFVEALSGLVPYNSWHDYSCINKQRYICEIRSPI